MRFPVYLFILSFIALCGTARPASIGPEPVPAVAPGRLLVEFRAGGAKARAAGPRVAGLLGGKVQRAMGREGRFALLAVPSDEPPGALARLAMTVPEVASAAPAYRRTLHATPNDPQFATHQWSMHNVGQTVPFDSGAAAGTVDADIDAPEAWDLATGSASVVAAVIDTGIGFGNADLAPVVWVNSGETASNGIDDDGNGYVDDVNGYNFNAHTASPADDHGHGSFCSGIIGARGNDATGLAGVNWTVRVMALKSFDASGNAYDPELVEAILYAADNGAQVINASWGDWLYSPVVEAAIRYAGERGVLFVTASGNDASNLREQTNYPANYALPNLLCVGSTNFRDQWSSFSNFDDTLVDIFAPGENIYATRQTGYSFGSGTSYATPHVVGVAALMLAHTPALTVPQLRTRLTSAVEGRTGLARRSRTGGRLSAYRALAAPLADTTPPAPVSNLAITATGTNGFRMTFTAPGDDAGVGASLYYDVRVSTQPITDANFLFSRRVPGMPAPGAGGSLETIFVNELDADTDYYVRLIAGDDAGNTTPLSNMAIGRSANRTVIFSDNMESGDALWTTAGGFARTTESAHSGSWCWTDSPGGDYANNKVATLTSVAFSLAGITNPWVTFRHKFIFENVTTTFYDGAEVQVSTDGSTFTNVALYYDGATPWQRAMISLADYAGQPVVYLRFRFHSDSVRVADGWYIDDVEVLQPASMVPEPADFVVESRTPFAVAGAPVYSETTDGGTWFDSASKAVAWQMRASRSRYNVTTSLGSTARFTPSFPVSGMYDVYAIWGISANATNVRHRVSHAQGTTDVYLTQNANTNSNQWVSVGTFQFTRGRNAGAGSVLVDESTVSGKPIPASEGRVYADAIRFVYRGPIPAAGVGEWPLY